MSTESTIGRLLHDSNDVVKNQITTNIANAVQTGQLNLAPEHVQLLVNASHSAVDAVGLNVVSTIARFCDKKIEESTVTKPTRGRRKK